MRGFQGSSLRACYGIRYCPYPQICQEPQARSPMRGLFGSVKGHRARLGSQDWVLKIRVYCLVLSKVRLFGLVLATDVG